MLTIPFSCLGNEHTGWSVLAALSVLLNFLMRHRFPAVSQPPSPVFTLWIIFFKKSFTALFVYPFFKAAGSPPLYWPEPVWPVSVECGLSFSTCTPAYLVWGGCEDPHLFCWPLPGEVPATTALPALGCGTGQASPSPTLPHSTAVPFAQSPPCGMGLSSRAGFLVLISIPSPSYRYKHPIEAGTCYHSTPETAERWSRLCVLYPFLKNFWFFWYN